MAAPSTALVGTARKVVCSAESRAHSAYSAKSGGNKAATQIAEESPLP